MSLRLRIGARTSPLSLRQARHAIAMLGERGVVGELCPLSSSGDRDRESPIDDLPGDAPFADDLQDALRAGESGCHYEGPRCGAGIAAGRVSSQRRIQHGQAAAARGWLDERAAILEALTAIRRAGADAIITYFAVDAARILRGVDHGGA